jgi:hypothetical protein
MKHLILTLPLILSGCVGAIVPTAAGMGAGYVADLAANDVVGAEDTQTISGTMGKHYEQDAGWAKAGCAATEASGISLWWDTWFFDGDSWRVFNAELGDDPEKNNHCSRTHLYETMSYSGEWEALKRKHGKK